jgi:hypothetical protein
MVQKGAEVTAREFIILLETYMPDLNVPLEIKFADTGEACNIYPAGGTTRVVFYIVRNEHPHA